MEQETNQSQYKHFNRLLVIFCIVLLLSSLVFFLLLNFKINRLDREFNEEYQPVFEENNVENEKTTYILKEYNGKIGIFENDALIYTLDTYVFTLPENDKKLLKDGITVSTKEELYELLEEYY
ncbi:MAG: hypothetical protein J6C61_07010 [Clostridia bacterium]|nr:hypothetical protein [Clostridia bacterium]